MNNTEILQASKAADPDGNRTIGVLTKLDLVDKGAEDSMIELLENRTKTLKLGYHGVSKQNLILRFMEQSIWNY